MTLVCHEKISENKSREPIPLSTREAGEMKRRERRENGESESGEEGLSCRMRVRVVRRGCHAE